MFQFSGLIISGFGYSTFATLLLSMPAGGMQLLLLAITGFLTLRYHKLRMACMISLCIISIVGSVMMAVLPAEQKVSRLAGVYLTVAISINTPLLLSLVSSNVAGFTKKATVSAMIFIAYAGGNLAGPQFFLANEAPKYQVCIQRPWTKHRDKWLITFQDWSLCHFIYSHYRNCCAYSADLVLFV